MSNELTQTLRTRHGDVLKRLKEVATEQRNLEKGAKSLGKEGKKAIGELRKEFSALAKEATQIDQNVTKVEQSQRRVGKASKEAAQAGRDWTGSLRSGVAGLVAGMQALVQLQERSRDLQREASGQTGASRMELSTTLAGLGIQGRDQNNLIKRLEQIRGVASQGEINSFIGSLSADALTDDQIVNAATIFSALGGSKGRLGGQAGRTFGQLQANFSDRYSSADLADYTLLTAEDAGQAGLTDETMKHVNSLADAFGLERALAMATVFTRARQSEGLGQAATAAAKGASISDIMRGTSEHLPAEYGRTQAALRAAYNGADLRDLVRQRSERYRDYRGRRDYVGESVRSTAELTLQEWEVRAAERDMEILRTQSLSNDAARSGRRREIYTRGQLEAEAIAADGAGERIAAGAQLQSLGIMGADWHSFISGARGAQGDLSGQAAEVVRDVRIIADDSRKATAADLEEE